MDIEALLSEMYTSRHDVSSKACLTKGVSRNRKWRSVIFVLEVESYVFEQMSSFDAGETKQRGHLKGPMKRLQCHKKDPLENTVFSTILASGGPFSGQNGSRNRSPEGSGGVPGASGRAL